VYQTQENFENMYDLVQLAKQVMEEKGLKPDFPKEVYSQLKSLQHPAAPSSEREDLRSLLWCSIDNEDSRDLDQLTYAEKGKRGKWKLWVAVADVDALVEKGTPIDLHAEFNTTSVYTPGKIFPMLPEKLSTDLTSLNENEDRAAIVVRIHLDGSGDVEETAIFPAFVHNHAKLTYNSVGAWLAGGMMPEKVTQVGGLAEVLRIQNEVAQILEDKRKTLGSLTLESAETQVKVTKDQQILLELPAHDLAHQIIENFMIAANQEMALWFRRHKIPSLRRVVRVPKRWERIVEIAASYGFRLPVEPDSKALDHFLIERKKQDPETFPDLSLTIIKLLGRGEYIVETQSTSPVGHFGLALPEYTHSTAPNRRFPDLISQRLFKNYPRRKTPYRLESLRALAKHCTEQEDAAMKVERHLNKSAAALLLSSQIGKTFRGMITGASDKGTWVRICDPHIEGKVIFGFENLDVGDHVQVELVSVDIPKGYINFRH
jgi:exoribonuclease-2